MGLNIQVGTLLELTDVGEPEGVAHFRDQFAKINAFLATKGIRPHHEPEPSADAPPWSIDMFGYSGLHELRRVAVHLLAGNGVPAPADGATQDPLLKSYYAEKRWATPTPEAMRSPNHSTPWAFRHLLIHSDCEGYYLPINFRFVLGPPADSGIAGPEIGSSQRLIEECRALALAMGMPERIDPDSGEFDDLLDGIDRHPDDTAPWRRLPVAAHSCAALLKGATLSVQRNAALVFG